MKSNLPLILKTDQLIEEIEKDEKLTDKEFLRSSLMKNDVYHLAEKASTVDSAQTNWSDKMEGYISRSLKEDYEENFYNFIKAGRVK